MKKMLYRVCKKLYGGAYSRGKSGQRSMTAGIGRSMILGGK